MKKILTLLLAGLLSLGLFGCSSSSTPAESASAAPSVSAEATVSTEASPSAEATPSAETALTKDTVITVGDVQWDSVGALYKAAGLDDTPYTLNVSVFDGGNLALEALLADQIQIARTSEIPPIFASQGGNGGNFAIVAVLKDRITFIDQEILVGPNSTIASVAELKGKKIGYTKATTAHYFLYAFLQEAGIIFNDVELVEVNPSDGAAALLSGSIDALATFGNGIVAAKENGAKVIADGNDKLSGYCPIVVSTAALQDETRRAAVIDYIARLNQAYDWISKNPEAWAEVSAEPSGKTVEKTLEGIQKGLDQQHPEILTINDDIIASTQSIIDAFVDSGLLEKQVDAGTLYTDAYSAEIEEAISNYAK